MQTLGMCGCDLTVAKHQEADAQNRKPRHQAIGHTSLHTWYFQEHVLGNEQADYQPTRAYMHPHEKIILHAVQALHSTGTEQLLHTVHLYVATPTYQWDCWQGSKCDQ